MLKTSLIVGTLTAISMVLGLSLCTMAHAGLDDILYDKGTITKEEWLKSKSDQERQEGLIKSEKAANPKWYDKISLRGYTQFRYNATLDDKKLNDEYDSSIGDNKGFLIRRARLIVSGDVHERVSMYTQIDLAAAPPGTTGTVNNQNFAQIRDAYVDFWLTQDKEYRIRAGITKVPYSFDVLQSSQNRVAFDRSDALNSGVPNERDTGLFFYYTPVEKRKVFKYLVDSGLKGSGDYGIFGIGVYNGQSLNVSEANDNKHVVLHSTYPFELPYGQIVQVGVDAYRGLINVPVTPGTKIPDGGNINDERIGTHFVLYPQPFGLQAEWNWGRGPEYNATTKAVQEGYLQGGYVQAMYKYDNIMPYVRWQEYHGGKKNRPNSPFNSVNETELGVEYQINKSLELTVAYAWMKRTDTINAPYDIHNGQVARFQLQWNY
jgi:hypothetical protein